MFYSHCTLAGKLEPAAISDKGGHIPCELQGCAGGFWEVRHSLIDLFISGLENLCALGTWGKDVMG